MSDEVPVEIFKNPAAERICQWLRIDNPSVEGIEHLSDSDWDATLLNAIRLGLAPICYVQLKALKKLDYLPLDVLNGLKSQYFASSAQALQRRLTLRLILSNFMNAEIPVILLKGAHLAEAVYKDPAARLMTDLDLMVARQNLDRASDVLARMGYRPTKSFWSEYETTFSHQLPIFTGKGLIPIELHWTILTPDLPYKIDINGLWERSQKLQASDIEIQVLSPNDLILHLGLHASMQHKLTGGLRLIYDIAATLDTYGELIDWSIIVERTACWNANRAIYLVLRLCHSIFGIGAPQAILSELEDPSMDNASMEVAKDLLFINKDFRPDFSRNFAEFLEKKTFKEKFALVYNRLFPSKKELAEDYPVLPSSPRVWLFYPVHWIGLTKKHLGTFLEVMLKDESTLKSAHLSHLVQEREDTLHKQIIGHIGAE